MKQLILNTYTVNTTDFVDMNNPVTKRELNRVIALADTVNQLNLPNVEIISLNSDCIFKDREEERHTFDLWASVDGRTVVILRMVPEGDPLCNGKPFYYHS